MKKQLLVIVSLMLVFSVGILAPPAEPTWVDYKVSHSFMHNIDQFSIFEMNYGYSKATGTKFTVDGFTWFYDLRIANIAPIFIVMNRNLNGEIILIGLNASSGITVTIPNTFSTGWCHITISTSGLPVDEPVPFNITVRADNYDHSEIREKPLLYTFGIHDVPYSNVIFNGANELYVHDGYDYGADILNLKLTFYKEIEVNGHTYVLQSVLVNNTNTGNNYAEFDNTDLVDTKYWVVTVNYKVKQVQEEQASSEEEEQPSAPTNTYIIIGVSVVAILAVALYYMYSTGRLASIKSEYSGWVEGVEESRDI